MYTFNNLILFDRFVHFYKKEATSDEAASGLLYSVKNIDDNFSVTPVNTHFFIIHIKVNVSVAH